MVIIIIIIGVYVFVNDRVRLKITVLSVET